MPTDSVRNLTMIEKVNIRDNSNLAMQSSVIRAQRAVQIQHISKKYYE